MKSKARTAPGLLKKKKKREYTEKELDLPKLNTITPVGVVKPKGKKKGKVFIDDQVGLIRKRVRVWLRSTQPADMALFYFACRKE